MTSFRPVLVENVEAYAPRPLGRVSLFSFGGKIVRVGPDLDRGGLARFVGELKLELEVFDGTGQVLIPGVIDPHEHLTGGSGESGFASQTPMITLEELVRGGITTVVGCVGVDTYCQNLPHLFGKVKGLGEEGISAFLYTGGYDIPPKTLTGDVRTDLILISEVIGAGETAISDLRSTAPTLPELARVVAAARTGGLLTGKAGVTHFHVGDERGGLEPLRQLLDGFDIAPECLYPTHVERKPALLREAAEITHRGVTVDMDTCEQNLPADLADFVRAGGDLARLTLSSDASITSPATLYGQFRRCILERVLPLETLIGLVTENPARTLKLRGKGRIEAGADADFVLADAKNWDIQAVVAGGRVLMRNGTMAVSPRYMRGSNRFPPGPTSDF